MAFIKNIKKQISFNLDNAIILSDNGSVNSRRMIRAAEVGASPRIGKLDLIEEPEDVIQHYKDAGFDIVEEMKKRDGNLLWLRARVIDADVANENGDYFSWEELIKEREIQSDRNKSKMPAYKTFEGVPIYTNHENSDIQKAKGKMVFAEIDEEDRCVYGTFYIDADAYPDIAKAVQIGTITDVSMGCFPPGTLVLTESGYQPIEKISISEKLIDANGNVTEIINKQIRDYSDELIKIEIEGGNAVRATKEHPFLVIRGSKTNNPEYINACELKKNDYVLFPKNSDYIMRKIKNISEEKYDGSVYNFETESNSYVVENCAVHNCQVEFSYCSLCGNKAEKESEWCLTSDSLITMSDGTQKCIDKIKNGDIVLTHNGNFKKVLNIMERDINECILQISSPLTLQPLNITKNHPMWIMDYENSICDRKKFKFIEAKNVNIKDFIETPLFDIKNKDKIDNNIKYYWTDRGLAQPVTNIQEKHYVGKVYNLEVEDDNSYVANGISVHNCNHLKERKGKKFSGVIDKGKRKGQKVQNEVVYEDNHDLKFIELSIVSDGAFSNCTITDVLPRGEVLTYAEKLRCTASGIKNIVAQNVDDLMQKRATSSNIELIDYLDSSQNILDKIELFSTSIMSSLSMQKEASMNKEAYMNVLDTLNDVLNKIEAVIISLLSRKDNIDLSHVAKISKAMSDLQQVISDLVDDGVGTLSDAVNFQQNEQMQPQQNVTPQNYAENGVGRTMGMENGNMQTQPVSNIIEGGGDMSAVPFQFSPELEPPGFQQFNQAGIRDKWHKFADNLQKANVRLGFVVENLDTENTYFDPNEQGGKFIMSKQLNERVANALMNKISTVVEQPIIATRDNGKFKVVISDRANDEIAGYYNEEKINWQPSSLTAEDIDSIRENRIASVTQKLMDDFVGHIKTASWNPVTPSEVQEVQISGKREGNPEDVQEVQISSKRSGNPDDVQEVQISEKREGNPDEKTEHRLQKDNATTWGRKGNPEDVQELQIGEVRKDVDNRVWEHKLESRRSKTSESKVATASLNALACAVCDSGASPSEILEVAKEAAEDENLSKNVAAYFNPDSYKSRIASRERVDLGIDEPSYKNIPTAMAERIADILVEDEGITPQDIKTALNSIISAPKEGMKKLIGKFAREQAKNVRMASSGEKSRDDLIKGAVYAAMADAYDEPLDRSHLKVALFAVAETAAETEATPDEIFEVIENINDDQNALVTIETERLPNAMASRIRNKERKEFWGRSASSDKTPSIEKVLFASLADYAEAMESSEDKELPSHLIWQVAKKLASGGENARILVDAAIQARTEKPTRDAASLTDRTDTVREIRLSMDEIPSVDPSSDEFAETVRDYTIAFLQNKGYRVDPETFNFTRLTVNDKAREIVAVVQSSIIKEFGDEEFTVEENMSEMPEEFGMGLDPESLITPMAMQQRKNKREALMRQAQAAPGGDAMGGAPMGGGMPSGGAPESPDGGPGLSSLLGGADVGGEGLEEETDLNNVSNPGQVKPIGSICPACGSTNVDLAASRGECSDCNTKFDLKVSLDNIVTPDEKDAIEPDMGDDLGAEGLGAALAPPGPEAAPPAPGGAPGAGGGAPGGDMMGGGMPMAASVSWYGTPQQFVKLAKNKSLGFTDEQIAGPKPPGTICIACGNKNVRRAKSQYFCDSCGTIGKIDIKESNKHDDKLIFTVSYLLPPLS